eukprot:TRINITY_DN19343_c0_g1_i1.p1 TRINITY_DN19343_c0_g1~~TRINITY_DN19343_c0_g1_i1.p1  ORF type:complete len:500 (-),score=91.58 TRINITY_DN19343_c0_g1_i1:325-1824(-)
MAAGLLHGPVRSLIVEHNMSSVLSLPKLKAKLQLAPLCGMRLVIKLGPKDSHPVSSKTLLQKLTSPPKHGTLPKVTQEESERTQQSAGDAFKQAIFQMEHSMTETAEILEAMQEKLSTSDLQLVLKYFAQEGKDSWCALEVFEWMQKMNKVEDDTHKLMMSIMLDWITKVVEEEYPIEFVKCLLEDMKCVGLRPDFRILNYITSVYWDKGKKAEVLSFVKDMLHSAVDTEGDMDVVSFLILKMAANEDQRAAVDFLKHLHASNIRIKSSAYAAGLLACLVEQEQLTLVRRQLNVYHQKGKIVKLDVEDIAKFNAYETSFHSDAEDIALWTLEDEASRASLAAVVYERLVAIYCVAGKGLEAERSMWQMKLAGRDPPIEVYNTIIGICGYSSQKEAGLRIINRMPISNLTASKKTYTCLIGGFVKGGHYANAADALQLMLDAGLTPDERVIQAVLRGLQKSQVISKYLELCKRLVNEGLIENCLLYLYLDAYNLCIIRML